MELVLVLPVILGLLLAVAQIGVVAYDRVVLGHVARAAARAAAVDPDPVAVATAARAASALEPERLTVTLGPDRRPGDRLAVTVSYRAPTRVPVVGRLVPDPTLSLTITVRVE